MTFTLTGYSTTQDSPWRELSFVPTNESANLKLTGEQHQLVEGFGGCFNELGYMALSHLNEEQRHEVFHSLFHPRASTSLISVACRSAQVIMQSSGTATTRWTATWPWNIFRSIVISNT